jgi:PAS domain S-box-containing protein
MKPPQETPPGTVEDDRVLSEREAHFRVLAEHLPTFIWAASGDGSSNYYNPAFLAYLGRTLDEMQPGTWVETLHPDDREAAARAWEHAKRTGERYAAEFRIRRASDGAYRWFLSRGEPMRREDGTILRWLGTVVDVHERVTRDERARERAEELETLLRTAPAAIWIAHDPTCSRITGSRFAHELLRQPEQANLSMSAPEGERPANFRVAHAGRELRPEELPIQRAARGEEIHGFEEEIVFDDGTIRHIYGNAVPLRDRDGHPRGAIGAFVDVTERRLAEEERERLLAHERAARAAAEAANRAMDQFLAIVSHELRTPLNAILGWTQILLGRGVPDEATARAIATIERNARFQARLIDDILDASRIMAGKVRLDARPIDVAALVRAVLDSQAPAADAKRVRVLSAIDPEAGPVVGDQGRLQQVIENLVSNAIKFTPEDGLVTVTLERGEGEARLLVRDSGVGIDPDFLPFVFEPFRQADPSASRRHGGLGLGLAIARQLVELHGGTLAVESRGLGHGALFTVRLPLAAKRAEGGAESTPPPPPAEARDDLRGVRVLVVDDEPDALSLIEKILADRGAEVHASASASEALAAIRSFRPAVLVSDIGMPEHDGYWLIDRVRALPPEHGGHAPALALTAFAGPEERARALARGYQIHMAKPLDVNELVAAVAALRRKRRAR